MFAVDPITVPHIFEPSPDGHRLQYVRRILEQMQSEMRIHLSTLATTIHHPAFLKLKELRGECLIVHVFDDSDAFLIKAKGKGGLQLQWLQWKLFRDHWKSLPANQKGDQILLPFLDNISYAIGAFGSPFGGVPLQGLVMRPSFHWKEMGVKAPVQHGDWLKKFLFLRLLKSPQLSHLITIDPSLFDWLKIHPYTGSSKVRFMDDPADLAGDGDHTIAKQYFGIPSGNEVVLMFGGIDERKGVQGMLKYLISPENERCFGLIVGRQSPEVRKLLASSTALSDRIICIDRYVDSQDEWLAFQAADRIWLAYEGFYGPSGVLAQAIQCKKSIISNGFGVIGYILNSRKIDYIKV